MAALYGEPQHVIMVLVAAFPVTFFLALFRPRRENVSWAIAATLFGVLWIGLAIVHAVWLRELAARRTALVDRHAGRHLHRRHRAYFGGRFYGRPPLAPLISPNKTLEGLVIGIIGGTAAFWLRRPLPGLAERAGRAAAGLCVALAAPVGDLFESLIKRDLEVKDTGRLFGPHGGVLDRLDACFFDPVAYYAAIGSVRRYGSQVARANFFLAPGLTSSGRWVALPRLVGCAGSS